MTNDRGFVPQDERFENGGTMCEADKTSYWIVEPKSFAYNPARINVGSIGYQSTSGNVIVSSLYEVFQTDETCDNRFLWHWFKTRLFTQQIEMLQEGGVRLYFFFDKLLKSEISMPSVDEQRLIGEQFDWLDSLITLHQRKCQYRGLYGYLSWEQRKLGEVATRHDNLRIPITAKDRIPGDTPYYGANGIQDYVEGYTHEGEFVLVAEDGATDLDNYPVQLISGLSWVNNHAHVIKAIPDVAQNRFIMYLIKSMGIASYLVGGTRSKLNAEVLMGIELKLPSNSEQIYIGALLSTLDSLITLHQ